MKKCAIWKIQLTIAINFISYKDNNEECLMYLKSDNMETMINNNADESLFLYHFLINIKLNCKHQREVVILSLIVFIYCFICHKMIIYRFSWLDKQQKTINKVYQYKKWMLSICCNCRVKSWKNKKTSAKKDKNIFFR